MANGRVPRIIILAWAVAMLSGCTFNVWENISPKPEGYWDFVRSVQSAIQRDDGSVVVCVSGLPAATPAINEAFILEPSFEGFSLILPADTTGRLGVDDAHASLRRYDLTSADVAGACADGAAPGTALPVHTVRYGDLGIEEYTSFEEIPDAALAGLVGSRAGSPVVYVYANSALERRTIFYAAPEARFDGVHAVHIKPGRRAVTGNPAYVVVLPFAALFDLVVSLPVFFVAVVTGIYRG